MVNWGLIHSGATFETLVGTLLLFEDPTNRAFGRLGADAGIDAQNEAGTIVWQSKFHSRPTLSQAIADALKELGRIKKYRRADDPRAVLWQKTKEWRLVTNLKFNPPDLDRWAKDVVPEFEKEDLKAVLWGEEILEQLLTKHPSVRRSFFEGENRCFLSLKEAFEIHESESPRDNSLSVPITGRDAVIAQLIAFLDGPKKVICIHGPGGVGKTRLLLEVGALANEKKGYQVLWGNVETMAQSSNWLAAVTPERPTLLLVDEPDDARVISILAEQLRGRSSRLGAWKVVLAARSPKDPVFNAYESLLSSIREPTLELKPVQNAEAQDLIAKLLDSGPLSGQPPELKQRAAAHIAQISNRLPVWMSLAVRVLETTGSLRSLPSSVAEIARKYVSDVIEHQSALVATQPQIQKLIRWLALYRIVNTENPLIVGFLAKKAGFPGEAELKRALISLVKRKFAVNRGINGRLYETKPDVINEFILSDWLTIEDGNQFRPSPEADEIVTLVINGEDGKPIPEVRIVVRTLAEVELREKWQDRSVKLLDPLISALLTSVETETLTVQQTAISLLGFFSFARVTDSVRIATSIRTHPRPDQEIESFLFQNRVLTHREVVSELAWALFSVGQYADGENEKNLVLDEMIALFYAECSGPNPRRNDGKRPGELIQRLISGNRWFSYSKEVYTRAEKLLSNIKQQGDTGEDELKLGRVLIQPYISVERSFTEFNEHAFTVRNWSITPTSPEGKMRTDLRRVLRDLTDSPKDELAEFAWALLSEAHSSANRARQRTKDVFEEDIKEDLVWVKNRINRPNIGIKELQRARALWDWHAQFEAEPALKLIAEECEAVYLGNSSAREFDVFFDFSKYEEAKQKAMEYGVSLKNASADVLSAFIERAEAYAGSKDHWGEFYKIAEPIADAWEENPEVSVFVQRGLGRSEQIRQFGFAMALLDRRLRNLRDGRRSIIGELDEKYGWITSQEGRIRFFFFLFSRPHPLNTGLLTSDDVTFFLKHISFLEQQEGLELIYRCLSGMFHADWDRVRSALSNLWQRTPDDSKGKCFSQLLDGINFIRLFKDTFPVPFGQDHYDFLLSLLLTVPDLDELEGRNGHELEQLRNEFGPKPLSWLSDVFRQRANMFDPSDPKTAERGGKIISSHVRFSKFVQRVTAENCSDSSIQAAVAELMSFNSHRSLLGYLLPEYMTDVDPDGYLVPSIVVGKLQSQTAPTPDEIHAWSRYAASYGFASPPWRAIAAAATAQAVRFPQRGQTHIFLSLENGMRSTSYPAGEMDPQPKQELDQTIKFSDEETDSELRPYWDWKVKFAQAQYDRALAEYNEERGE